ncbi:MAG: PDZ domain-containing protein [Anaerolineae bacterium]|nr:PDZ domain-containing protein [Anaerolineae bacterium]MDW8069023.1 PDZ domain-containing protein [Anaerolineae bacterium]
MDKERVELTGWQMIAVAVGLLVVVISCCFLGMLVGGAVGFGLGRAGGLPEPTQEWRPFPRPEVPTPEGPPSMLTPAPEERPYLGVRYIERPRGAEIVEVVPGSPAEEAGLQVGDLIREVDGRRVGPGRPLVELLASYRPGDRVTLKVERDGEEREIKVILGRWPSP